MGAAFSLCPLLYEFIMGNSYRQAFLPWPVWNFVFEFGLSVSIFGYLFGEWIWKKKEKDYQKPTEGEPPV